jgi:hypothetical protein
MRKILSVFCIYSLLSSFAFSAGVKPKAKAKKANSSAFTLPEVKPEDLFKPCTHNEASLINPGFAKVATAIISKDSCESVSDRVATILKLDRVRCETVVGCNPATLGWPTDDSAEAAQVDEEIFEALVRNTAKGETDYYHFDAEFLGVSPALDSIKLMPKSYQEKINTSQCEVSDKDIGKTMCDGDGHKAQTIRNIITANLAARAKQRLNDLKKTDDQSIRGQALAQLTTRDLQIDRTAKDFTGQFRALDTELYHVQDSADLMLNKPPEFVVNALLKEFKSLQSKQATMTSKDISDIVKNVFEDEVKGANFLEHTIKNAYPDWIENAIAKAHFNANDFNDKHPEIILSKIANIRIELANNYIQENCEFTSSTMDQVCSKITKSINSPGNYEALLAMPHSLEAVRNAHPNLSPNYLEHLLQAQACKYKFQDLNKPARDITVVAIKRQAEQNAEAVLAQQIATKRQEAKDAIAALKNDQSSSAQEFTRAMSGNAAIVGTSRGSSTPVSPKVSGPADAAVTPVSPSSEPTSRLGSSPTVAATGNAAVRPTAQTQPANFSTGAPSNLAANIDHKTAVSSPVPATGIDATKTPEALSKELDNLQQKLKQATTDQEKEKLSAELARLNAVRDSLKQDRSTALAPPKALSTATHSATTIAATATVATSPSPVSTNQENLPVPNADSKSAAPAQQTATSAVVPKGNNAGKIAAASKGDGEAGTGSNGVQLVASVHVPVVVHPAIMDDKNILDLVTKSLKDSPDLKSFQVVDANGTSWEIIITPKKNGTKIDYVYQARRVISKITPTPLKVALPKVPAETIRDAKLSDLIKIK